MLRRLFIALVMSFSFFNLFGQTTQSFKSVDVAEFEKAVADATYTVLDVRTVEEYAEGHIPGTNFNIDVLKGQFTSQALKLLPKDKPVALYCRSGNRSKTAARILAENGYKVLELATGIRGWISEGRPIEK